MRWTYVLVLVGLIGLPAKAETIDVSAAISLKESMEKIATIYHDQTGDDIKLNLGASGQLAAQIASGAPVDLFISAAQKQVDDLVKKDAADADTRKIVARNAMVLVISPDETGNFSSLADLKRVDVKRIAVGEPRSVPAGEYAAASLKNAKVFDEVKDKLVFGANVRQVLDYVARGEVSAGLVYATDAKQAGRSVRVGFVVDETLHDPIVYPSVLIKGAKHRDAAAKFQLFLISPAAQAILADAGFAPPSVPTTQPAK